MKHVITQLQHAVLHPVAALLYPAQAEGGFDVGIATKRVVGKPGGGHQLERPEGLLGPHHVHRVRRLPVAYVGAGDVTCMTLQGFAPK